MKHILFNVSRGIAILFVVGLAMMILAGRWGLLVLKEPVDFEMLLEQKPENGMYVKGEVIFAYDCFATEDELAEANILMIQQPKSLVSLISIFWLGLACVLIAVLWFVIKMIRSSKNEKAV